MNADEYSNNRTTNSVFFIAMEFINDDKGKQRCIKTKIIIASNCALKTNILIILNKLQKIN